MRWRPGHWLLIEDGRIVDIGAELFAISAAVVYAQTVATEQPERADSARELVAEARFGPSCCIVVARETRTRAFIPTATYSGEYTTAIGTHSTTP